MNFTGVKQLAVIHFLWPEGVTTSQIYRRMLTQYGEKCIGQKGFLCSTLKHTHILQQPLFQQSGSRRFNSPPHTHTPPLQSNQAALDYHMFGPLKKALFVQRLASGCVVKEALHITYVSLITIHIFLHMWDQKVCELLHNMH